MTLFLYAIFLLALGYLLYVRLKTLLTYFQQEEYDGGRFLSACGSIRLFDLKSTLSIGVLYATGFIGLPPNLILIFLSGILIFIAWKENNYVYKKPLKLTERARRIFILSSILLAASLLLVTLHILLAIIVLQSVPFVLIISNRILAPFQARINQRFESQANEKLNRMNPARIGITGSFGKTTVKHMLAEILEASSPVFYSRGSVNTILGLTRHIRGRLQWSHRYFIAEMGAYGEGSIQRLCNFVEPDYGIVTAIGDAHTERFGSIEAIARAKAELAQDVCGRGGMVVINANALDYEPFAKLKSTYSEQVITVGHSNAEVIASGEPGEHGSWIVSLSSALDSIPSLQYEIPLLGEHNILNSALAVSLALAIDPEISVRLSFFTKEIPQIPHRLQKIDNPGQPLILDDAFNSNEAGFKAAVTVLSNLAGQRGGRSILVTPGITELGLEHDRVHNRLGEFCSNYCDTVYVVNSNRIKSFVAALNSERVNVIEVATLADARREITQDLIGKDVVLYENDLPDILEEQRLL